MSLEEEQISYVVIGVGINVNHDEFPEELAGRATSLKTGIRQRVDPG